MSNIGTAEQGYTLIGQNSGESPKFDPIGTLSGLTAHGPVIAQDADAFTVADPGTTGYVFTSNGSMLDPTFQALSGGGFKWYSVTGTVTMLKQSGYFPSNNALVTLILPSTASSTMGDTIRIQGASSGGWIVTQSSGQIIFFGTAFTTTGAGGSLASTNEFDAITLTCFPATNSWGVSAVQGNLIVT